MANYVYFSNSGDGYLNLATDGYFLENVKKGDVILYFYINSNAVIIGRNQNAWRECNLQNLERDEVQLVRRHTGGGAVYHDRGNLNFSFIMSEKIYDKSRQFSVIARAVEKLGIKTELSGRNDILIEGRKFSGNAYGLYKGNRAHHGTLLVNAELSKLGSYLNVSAAKMRAKGVESVQSRVCNLSEFAPGITSERMRELVTESFIEEYGEAGEYVFAEAARADIERRRLEQASWEWRFGKSPRFEMTLENRFSFGEIQFHLDFKEGSISNIKVYSDCLDVSLNDELEKALLGCRFDAQSLKNALTALENRAAAEEIGEFLAEKTL